MTEEFGSSGFAFTMTAEAGVIATHNAADGFVVPLVMEPSPPAATDPVRT